MKHPNYGEPLIARSENAVAETPDGRVLHPNESEGTTTTGPSQDKGVPTTCGNKTHSDLAGDRESQPEMVDRPEVRVSTSEL